MLFNVIILLWFVLNLTNADLIKKIENQNFESNKTLIDKNLNISKKIQRDISPFMNFQRQYGYGTNLPNGMFNQNNYGNGNGNDNNVNFDFQCKCSARSNLGKNVQIPNDANQAAQQTIQQLQDQIKRLNEQIQRISSGKTSFEQFAQMLAQADGLECNCSGASSAVGNFPINSNINGYRIGNNLNSHNTFPFNSASNNYNLRNINGYGGQQQPGLMSSVLGFSDGQYYPTPYGASNSIFYGRSGLNTKA